MKSKLDTIIENGDTEGKYNEYYDNFDTHAHDLILTWNKLINIHHNAFLRDNDKYNSEQIEKLEGFISDMEYNLEYYKSYKVIIEDSPGGGEEEDEEEGATQRRKKLIQLTPLPPLPPLQAQPPTNGSGSGGGKGGKKTSKKEVLGKMRYIYKIPGDRKEYVKYKGKLITIKDYKALIKQKAKKKSKPKKKKKSSEST